MAFGQVFVNWLLLGSLYAAVALGFSLVWGIMNIVNLAHGAFIIVGAYTAFWLYTQLHIDPYLGIPLTMAVLFVVGWIVQYVAINRVIRAPLLVTFLLTFGLDLLITDLIQQFFSSDLRSINTAYAGNGLWLDSHRFRSPDRSSDSRVTHGGAQLLSHTHTHRQCYPCHRHGP